MARYNQQQDDREAWKLAQFEWYLRLYGFANEHELAAFIARKSFVLEVLHHTESPPRTLGEFNRVLAKDGVLNTYVYSKKGLPHQLRVERAADRAWQDAFGFAHHHRCSGYSCAQH